MKEKSDPEHVAAERARVLRQRAEDRTRTTRSDIQHMSPEEVQRLVYELQIHQIELQMQNEELQRAQQELTATRDRYSDLYDFAPVGYVTLSLDSVIQEANLTTTKLLGTERAHLIGTRLSRFISPDGQDVLAHHLQRLRTERALCACEVTIRRFDGQPMIVKLESIAVGEAHGRPLQTRTILSDITARKQAEVQVQESEARYRNLFESAGDAIALFTLDGTITEVNRAALRLLGWSREEMVGQHFRKFARPESGAFAEERTRRFLAGDKPPVATFESELVRKDGSLVTVETHTRTLRDRDNNVVGFQGIYRDLTARKHDEHALEALSRRVLEIQETERRALARELHDEVGQALIALRLNVRAVQRAPHQQSTHLEDCLHIIDQLVQQVRQLSLDLRPSLLDDVGLVAALRWYIDRQAQRSGLAIHFTTEGLESRLSPLLETTCFRVSQGALTNVLRHAHAHHAWVELQRDNKELYLCIRDDGIGFDMRAVRERASQGESLGILGMEERVRLVGGYVRLTSAPTQGTEICAHFPLTPTTGVAADGK